MRVVIGCDHGGYSLKDHVINLLKSKGYEIIDVGTHSADSVDYPDYAVLAAKEINEGRADKGIVICGSGIGISIAANKCAGIRCALCHDHLTASLSRQHNNANMVALGARIIGVEVATDIVLTFLNTEFEGGRHERRVTKIAEIEKD